jgi:predicted dehydrogenase
MAVMSIHWFDGYRFLLRDEPETVYCRALNSPATEGGEDTAISAITQFKTGTVVSLDESFSSFTRPFSTTLDCEDGGLVMEYGKMTEVRSSGERIEHNNPYDKAEATYFVLDDLLSAVEDNREPETSVFDNLNSMRYMEAAYQSMETGKVIRVEDIK